MTMKKSSELAKWNMEGFRYDAHPMGIFIATVGARNGAFVQAPSTSGL